MDMGMFNKIMKAYFAGRLREIEHFRRFPAEVQRRQLDYLLDMGRRTAYGVETGLGSVSDPEEFRRRVPIRDYEECAPYILRQKAGESNVVWPSKIRWFAKSSGTTDAKSKYIPVSEHGLRHSHLQGPRDVIALFSDMYPSSKAFAGKSLTLGGSKRVESEGENAFSGDLSAILISNTPWYAGFARVPKADTALTPDFDVKVRRICEESVGRDVRSFAGVPSWNLVLMNRVLEYTGKSNLLEVWPRMELFMHGGMNFKPYREQYRRLIPSPDMKYMETYNASEGFFAIADDPARDDMLLMLDYRTYYEFLPMSTFGDHTTAVPIEGVRPGVNYALILTSSNGLWRYMIGDTVEFTSTDPYRIRITGRTKHYMNAFGEEIVVDNAETAVRAACDATGAEVTEFSAAPVYMEGREKGAHEWVVEFGAAPSDVARFGESLDRALQSLNSDYEAKRFRDTTLNAPVITEVPRGTFMRWLESKGKVGGQNKVPRLSNDRTLVEELKALGGM